MFFNMSTMLQLKIKIQLFFCFGFLSHQWHWPGLETHVHGKLISDLPWKVTDPALERAVPPFLSDCGIWGTVLPSAPFQGRDRFQVTKRHFSSLPCTHIQYNKNARLSLSLSYLWPQTVSKTPHGLGSWAMMRKPSTEYGGLWLDTEDPYHDTGPEGNPSAQEREEIHRQECPLLSFSIYFKAYITLSVSTVTTSI